MCSRILVIRIDGSASDFRAHNFAALMSRWSLGVPYKTCTNIVLNLSTDRIVNDPSLGHEKYNPAVYILRHRLHSAQIIQRKLVIFDLPVDSIHAFKRFQNRNQQYSNRYSYQALHHDLQYCSLILSYSGFGVASVNIDKTYLIWDCHILVNVLIASQLWLR